MGSAGDVDFYEGIFVTVVPFGGLFGLGGRARQKAKTVVEVFEHHELVIVGMQALFHNLNYIVPHLLADGQQGIQGLLRQFIGVAPLDAICYNQRVIM